MLTLLIAFVVGGFTNVAAMCKIDGAVLLPYIKTVGKKKHFVPGVLLDFVVGGLAALAAVSFLEPSGMLKVVGTSILAGFNGLTYLAKNALGKNDEEKKEVEAMYQQFMEEEIKKNQGKLSAP